MRYLAKVFGGKFRVWWVTSRRSVAFVAAFVFMVSSLAIPTLLKHMVEINQLREAHNQAVQTIAARNAAGNLPSVVFMIEAETPQAAREKLAKMAGQLDAHRGLIK